MENRLITEQLAEQIAKYPLYSQDGLGKAAICIGILELANELASIQVDGSKYGLGTLQVQQQVDFKPIALSSISDSRVKQFLSRFED